MPSRPRSSIICRDSVVIKRLRSRNTHIIIIMAEEDGVCHVNGEPEVVDGDLQNGEPDEDDKGYDI